MNRYAFAIIFVLVLLGFPCVTSAQSPTSAQVKGDGERSLESAPAVLQYFAKTTKDVRALKGVLPEYGISQSEFDRLAAKITALVIEPKFDHDPRVPLKERAIMIRNAVSDEIAKGVVGTKKPVLVERMVFQGLYDWIRTHFHYSLYLAKDGLPREVRSPYWEPTYVMAMPSPYCVCPGYANTMVEMGKASGLDCFAVNGFARRWFDSSKLPESSMQTWHKWVVLRKSDGLLVPADPTNASVGLEVARRLPISKWIAFGALPSAPEDWAVYAAVYYTSIRSSTGKALADSDQISALQYSEWKEIDVSSLRNRYQQHTGTVNWKSCLVD